MVTATQSFMASNFNIPDERDAPDAPPPYQTADPLPDHLQARASVRFEDTPRGRFDYHIYLRTIRQTAQWGRAYVHSILYGDRESQDQLARDWVTGEWQRHGIWDDKWAPTGPGHEKKWECGIPAIFLSMECEWEKEHHSLILNPVEILCVTAPETELPASREPELIEAKKLNDIALNNVLDRWKIHKFSSRIGPSVLQYRQHLPELHKWLPKPASAKLTSSGVQRWQDLRSGWDERANNSTLDPFGFARPDELVASQIEEWRRNSPPPARSAQQNDVAGLDHATGAETSQLRRRSTRHTQQEAAETAPDQIPDRRARRANGGETTSRRRSRRLRDDGQKRGVPRKRLGA